MLVLDFSEPDWCEYQVKIATRYLCPASYNFVKASNQLNGFELVNPEKRALSERAVF